MNRAIGQCWLRRVNSFFGEYAHILPILDASRTPNAYYSSSAFLFWAIVGVGCRTYARNPTLLAVLPSKILNLAVLTLNSHNSVEVVQGLLLILYWPFPRSSTDYKPNYVLTGAVVHLAMQLGLHLPVSGQEYSAAKLSLNSEELKRRSQIWGYCQLEAMRSNIQKGNVTASIFDIPYDVEQRRVVFDYLSPSQKFQLKVQDTVARCCIATSQNGLRVMSAEQERSLDILLDMFSAQLSTIGLEDKSGE